MAVTRDELSRRLKKLEADMPKLVAAHPDPGQFSAAFKARADAITGDAGTDHDVWAFEQLDRILEQHGLWRSDQENLPPDG